jgi:hypothetical protein
MQKYLVQVSIPTGYVIAARSSQEAMHKAVVRFQKEHHTQLEPEVQWAELTGADSAADRMVRCGVEAGKYPYLPCGDH